MLSFGNARSRSFGGVGVMVDRPGVHLRLRRATRLEARGLHAERALAFGQACQRAWNLNGAGCSMEVLAAPPGHAGLGSGTQLALAVAAGMRHLFGPSTDAEAGPAMPHPSEAELVPSEHDWLFDVRDAMDLARAVGRGRRSCVGVYGFSRGGLIVESGRKMAADAAPEEDATRDFSPMVARVRLPSAWRCVVIVGRDDTGLHGDAEKAAFARLPPVPAEVTSELARIALLELLPAAVEAKFAAFAQAIRRYGQLAGRPFEPESGGLAHAGATAQLLELLAELGFPGSAQSSWGPAVMACCETLEAAGQLVDALEGLGLGKHHDIAIARFDSQGASLRVVD
jgi:predicted sugar kinase